jgi:SM-20-related protein
MDDNLKYTDAIQALVDAMKKDASLLEAGKAVSESEKIICIDDQIPEDLLGECVVEVERRGWQYGWRSNKMLGFGHWNIVLSDSKVEREEVYHEVPKCIRDLWDYIQPRFLPTTPVLVRAYANAHTYGVEGYIHKDSKFSEDQTVIIYYEKDWKPEYAGETIFLNNEEDDIIRAILPKYGRMTIFPGNIKHAGRGVSRICPVARRVLVLKGRPR